MLVLNNSYELGTTYMQVFLLWILCSELVLSFACIYFVVTGHFMPFWGLSILRANLASTEKSAAGKVGLTLLRYSSLGCHLWYAEMPWANVFFKCIISSKSLFSRCHQTDTECHKLYFLSVGYRKPKKVEKHWWRTIPIQPLEAKYCWSYFAFIWT